MEDNDYFIGRYSNGIPGPLFLVFSGMHGNEPAGVRALEILFEMLDKEPEVNPDFVFHGMLLGLKGNPNALREGKRFTQKDLNRQWTTENIERIRYLPAETLEDEDRDLKELLTLIEAAIADSKPTNIAILDLHTTSAEGGIFAIASQYPESVHMGIALHVPVITGLLRGIYGTLMHYFTEKTTGVRTVAVGFEGGQHEDPLSVNRCIAATINCMRFIGCVRAEDVENRHDEILIAYSRGLPKVAELVSVHLVKPDDCFKMLPGFQNFQAVKKGQLLATDKDGDILAPADGCLLMPLYQPQGEEGFFLVNPIQVPLASGAF